jgi:DNA-binding transcriptional ArsR family regulator
MIARQVTDYRVLAALAHPLRRRLLDLLRVDGPATASMLAERTDQAVGNISHHVKVLENHGLIEQAPELARDRRERWWRSASTALRWSTIDFADDPAAEAASLAASALGLQRQLDLTTSWLQNDPADNAEWRTAAFNTDTWLRLTSGELSRLGEEILELVDRYRDRGGDLAGDGGDDAADGDDRPERRPVFFLARGFPARP